MYAFKPIANTVFSAEIRGEYVHSETSGRQRSPDINIYILLASQSKLTRVQASWFNHINHFATAICSVRMEKFGSSLSACLWAHYATNRVWCGQRCTKHVHSGTSSTFSIVLIICGYRPTCSMRRTLGSIRFCFTLEPPEQRVHLRSFHHMYMTRQAENVRNPVSTSGGICQCR